MRMKQVFICSPLRGDVIKNIANAKKYCRKAVQDGLLPIAPHVYFTQFLDDEIENERKQGIAAGLQLLDQCDEIWVFGNPTEGMKQEIGHATERGIPVIYKDGD